MTSLFHLLGIKVLLLTFLSAILAFAFLSSPVNAQTAQLCDGAGGEFVNGRCVNEDVDQLFNNQPNQPSIFQRVADILLFLTGAISVIMLIIGGIRYVLSNGDPQAVETAKNTILYAIIGLIITFLAFAAVNFVVNFLEGEEETSWSPSTSIIA